MKTKYIIANWKENPENLEIATQLVKISKDFHNSNNSSPHIVITHAIPSIFAGFFINESKNMGEKTNIILQNISCFEGGSHTGEISALQAKNLGIEMSLVGHSETRLQPQNPKGDEDNQVNIKIKNLLKENMWACLCVGEYSRDENDSNTYESFLQTQLQNCLKDITLENFNRIIIAYEPVWAIGKGAIRSATNQEIIETIYFIKQCLRKMFGGNIPNLKILYGGSVNENNAQEILNLKNHDDIEVVDGLLVGRASCDPKLWTTFLSNLQ